MLENRLSIIYKHPEVLNSTNSPTFSLCSNTHSLFHVPLRLSTQCHDNHGFNYSTNLVKKSHLTNNKWVVKMFHLQTKCSGHIFAELPGHGF